MPLAVARDAGSGKRSTVRKRYINGQVVKSEARLGDSLPTRTLWTSSGDCSIRRTVRSTDVSTEAAPREPLERRRGPFGAGERVQLTDHKSRHHTITLATGAKFHTHRGWIEHDDIIGSPEGTVVESTAALRYLVLRPQLRDIVLSMPRGATVVYPKDAAAIVAMLDLSPGDQVLEAGAGSGALSMSLLRAVGDRGAVVSFERRDDFAAIASRNVQAFLGDISNWTLTVGDLNAEYSSRALSPAQFDACVFDMLAPWECLETARHALRPGGTLVVYIATTTQMSRVVEDLRTAGCWREPEASELIVRGWHLEGLAVRPNHRMNGHTGFLVSTRRLADGVTPVRKQTRPAKGAYPAQDADDPAGDRTTAHG